VLLQLLFATNPIEVEEYYHRFSPVSVCHNEKVRRKRIFIPLPLSLCVNFAHGSGRVVGYKMSGLDIGY
jgi:hypothetical protein